MVDLNDSNEKKYGDLTRKKGIRQYNILCLLEPPDTRLPFGTLEACSPEFPSSTASTDLLRTGRAESVDFRLLDVEGRGAFAEDFATRPFETVVFFDGTLRGGRGWK